MTTRGTADISASQGAPAGGRAPQLRGTSMPDTSDGTPLSLLAPRARAGSSGGRCGDGEASAARSRTLRRWRRRGRPAGRWGLRASSVRPGRRSAVVNSGYLGVAERRRRAMGLLGDGRPDPRQVSAAFTAVADDRRECVRGRSEQHVLIRPRPRRLGNGASRWSSPPCTLSTRCGRCRTRAGCRTVARAADGAQMCHRLPVGLDQPRPRRTACRSRRSRRGRSGWARRRVGRGMLGNRWCSIW